MTETKVLLLLLLLAATIVAILLGYSFRVLRQVRANRNLPRSLGMPTAQE